MDWVPAIVSRTVPSTANIIRGALVAYTTTKILRWIWRSTFVRSTLYDLPGPPPQSWFKGNLGQLFSPKGLDFHQSLVDTYGGIVKVYGFFGDEQLYISDPKALHSITLKDQGAFEETSVFLETNKVIFGPGLVATKGEQHRRQRKMTAPIFGVAQLRQIVPTFYDIAEKLADVLSNEVRGERDKRQTLDMSAWMSRVALESVGRTILGYSFDPLDSPHNNAYTSAVKDLIPTIFTLALVRQFAPFLVRLGPPWLRRKLVEWIPNDAVQKLKGMSDVMHGKAKEILELKYQELEDNPDAENEAREGRLKDIISALVKANESAPEGERLSENELTGQMTVLIFGAQDTTSSALSRILWQLSIRIDVQERIRKEAQECQRQSSAHRLSYEDIMALPWLDAVIKESLRLRYTRYPPVPFVRRVATKDCIVPYTPEGHKGESSQVLIPSGTTLFVSIVGSNRLESVWGEDAKQWKPERWLSNEGPERGKERLPGVYSGMMSFLGGQRSCVGHRFAQVEMKIILATLLTRFKFSLTKDEIVWSLSQIIAPSVKVNGPASTPVERRGLPLFVETL
ncbi:cytochrome P450 [Macrolepiota fuliginosa MF-IS2]|uniref:Cytochrome P450 n=1 Tax=Macrolepiota fuliginosa MF-IS2 TaxID=1400762 RepID=A0A9P5X794_9AGAR|nr:cytochrome P450 [Macrolepiota fuliginosa MF-IS2]